MDERVGGMKEGRIGSVDGLNQMVEAWKKTGCAEGSSAVERLMTALKEMRQW
jgi:hypothetical protein